MYIDPNTGGMLFQVLATSSGPYLWPGVVVFRQDTRLHRPPQTLRAG